MTKVVCTRVIAAYNTGAGNVARVFNKDSFPYQYGKASKVINELTPQEAPWYGPTGC